MASAPVTVGPKYFEPMPAPCAVFQDLEARRDRPRFMVPSADGDWAAVTWGDYARDIARVALWLDSQDLAREDRAAIFAPNRVEWMEAAMAIQAAGGAMVPIYGSSTAEQAAYVIEHCDAKVVFVDTQPLVDRLAAALDRLDGVRRFVLLDPTMGRSAAEALGADRVVRWRDVLAAGERREAQGATIDALLERVSMAQMGMMLYTSGTSGNPKGVPLTHANVAANGRDWLECNAPLLAPEADVDVLWLPFSHIFGFGEACLGNNLGFTSWLSSPLQALGTLARVKPTVFMSVPAYWEKLASLAAGDPAALRELTGGRLRFCLSGGAGLKIEVKEAFQAAGMLIVEGYGLTESSPTLTLNRPDAFRFDTVGRPLPSVALRLAEDGEIQARGPNVFGGYHKDPAATAQAFTADGWLRTGDLGRFTEDGFLQIIGRIKEILVTAGGKNVPPANIETRFADDPLFGHVMVYGDAKRYLVAGVWPEPVAASRWLRERAVEPQRAAEALEEELWRRVEVVNQTLARHETLKKIRVFHDEPLTVDGGELTATLKLRRHKIGERFGARLEELYG